MCQGCNNSKASKSVKYTHSRASLEKRLDELHTQLSALKDDLFDTPPNEVSDRLDELAADAYEIYYDVNEKV